METILRQLLDGFERNPIQARQALRELAESDRVRFGAAAMPALRAPNQTAGFRFLVTYLAQNDMLVAALSDPAKLNLYEAIAVARVAMKADPDLAARLAEGIAAGQGSAKEQARRLDLLAAVGEPGRILPLLARLQHHSDERIRSKIAKLLGRINKNPNWLRERMKEDNARVRANAIEAMWGVSSEEIRSALRGSALDGNARVAGNSVYGLYLAGDPACLPALKHLVDSPDEGHRITASWVMGMTLDDRFRSVLDELAADDRTMVRLQAVRARGRLAKRTGDLPAASLEVIPTRLETTEDGARVVGVSVLHGSDEVGSVSHLQFTVRENGRLIWDYTVQELHRPERMAIGFVLDSAWTPACSASLHAVAMVKRPMDEWSLVAFGGKPEGGGPTMSLFGVEMRSSESVPDPIRFSERASDVCTALAALKPNAGEDLIGATTRLAVAMCDTRLKNRIVVAASQPPPASRIPDLENLAAWIQKSGAELHVMAPAEAAGQLEPLCRLSRGEFHPCSTERDAALLLTQFYRHMLRRYEIRYRPLTGGTVDSVSVRISGDRGAGESALTRIE